jgi:hypothetical protein
MKISFGLFSQFSRHKAQESANATMKKLSPATGQQAQTISANSHLYQLPRFEVHI